MISVHRLSRTAFAGALFAVCLAGPTAADVACGPGMRMVGMQTVPGGPQGQAPSQIPACAPEGGHELSPSVQSPEIALSPLNAAIVWWNDASGRPHYSFAVGRLYSTAAAEDAMAHCFLSGGWNCRPGIAAAGGWIAITRSDDGSLFAAHAMRKRAAEKSALARCAEAHTGCRTENMINNRN